MSPMAGVIGSAVDQAISPMRSRAIFDGAMDQRRHVMDLMELVDLKPSHLWTFCSTKIFLERFPLSAMPVAPKSLH